MLLKVPLFILVIGAYYTSGDAATTDSDRVNVQVITSTQSTQNVKPVAPVNALPPNQTMTPEVKKPEEDGVKTTVTITVPISSISTIHSTPTTHSISSTSTVPAILSTNSSSASHSTTTLAPNSTSSASHSTTTLAPNSTTSASHSTTTLAPNSTTSASHSTTTPAPNSTTSVPHSTISLAPPTPTPGPAPVETGDWHVGYTATSICMRLVSQIKLHFDYGKGNETGHIDVAVPKSANVVGNCSVGKMNLSWTIPKFLNQTGFFSVQFAFSLGNDNKTWKLDNVTVKINLPGSNSVNHTIDFLTNKTGAVNARVGSSYMCLKSNSFSLTSNESSNQINVTKVDLILDQLQVEAFKPEKPDNIGFGSANNCKLTSDIVPIVVGCALAALVVIVLIAYLFAQRRPPAQGYRSV